MSDFQVINRAAFEENGVSAFLDGRTEPLFERLCRILQEKNAEMNITAITDDDGVARKHFCDCIFLCSLLPDEGKMADIGCGGGFPCLPVAITKPNVSITAVDSTAKKVNYVHETARTLGLDNLSGAAIRAEEGAQTAQYREQYDIVTARAVASLAILCELCIPYLKVGGRFFAMKGRGAQEELAEAKHAVSTLGAEVVKTHEFELHADGEVQTRYIIEIKKTSPTPPQYPRQYGRIKKKPL